MKIVPKNIDELAANNIRILSMTMVENAKSGHPGGAMGGADFMHILYAEFLKFDPDDSFWINRDRFFMDPGHMSPLLYSVLTLTGRLKTDDLKLFRQWGSSTPGHPELDVIRGIENTSGPLGQGHTMAVGAAIAERFLVARFGELFSHKIYAYISDGGIQEEVSQGAGRLAGHLGLNNLIMFYDSNNIQLSTCTDSVSSEDTSMKYNAWGWEVIEIDGNNSSEIREALSKAVRSKDRPVLIIGNTTMGKGLLDKDGNRYEGKCSTHGCPVSDAGGDYHKSVLNLGGDVSDPFAVFPEVKYYYKDVLNKKREEVNAWRLSLSEWREKNDYLNKKLDYFYSGNFPEIDFSSIQQDINASTRVASSKVLGILASSVENMVVASADLSNSDKTDGFLKHTKPFIKKDFSGAFLQAGVSELTMACIMNGMALHGGVIPACGTFFVFSDYMKPAVRLAALMELPVKYIWTHDSFRVGEDGPTHQPVEHEAQIRLMEKIKNHKGCNSLLVFRPSDAAETNIAWQLAMENKNTPSVLLLSRQEIASLPSLSGNRYLDAKDSSKGAYIVTHCSVDPDIILVANGSEVSTLIKVANLLKEENLNARVVAVPSEGLFWDQPIEYIKSVIPEGIPVFGLTAGLPVTLQGLAGLNGQVFGLNSFGFSAPYKVLEEHLGFTPEAIHYQIKRLLKLKS